MDRVEPTDGVFITAEGLLMYLDPEEALGLIRDCAARFPGGADDVRLGPAWFSNRTSRASGSPTATSSPPMPFGQSADEALAMAGTHPRRARRA